MEVEMDILQAISTVGFPIAVAVWFMVVGHKDSEKNTQAINNMTHTIDNNTKAIERLHKEDISNG